MDKRIYIITSLLLSMSVVQSYAQEATGGTATLSRSGGDMETSGSVPQAKGLNWSLSTEKLNAIQLSTGSVYTGLLTKDTPEGLEIVRISAPGPAYDADLRVGDKISALNGHKVRSTAELSHYLKRNKAGELSYWTIRRDDQLEVKSVRLVGRKERPAPEFLYYNLAKTGLVLFQSMETEEIFIEDVNETSFAFESGLMPGDQILQVSGEAVKSIDQIDRLLSRRDISHNVIIKRDGMPLDLMLIK